MSNNLNWLDIKGLNPDASHTTRSQKPTSSNSRDLNFRFEDPLLSPESRQQSIPAQGPVTVQLEPIVDVEGPPPATEEGYIPAFLRRNIGKNVRAEFIIGSNQYTDRNGRIIEVGTNYFVLEDINSRTHIMCDLYSVKFVTILPS